MSARWTVGGITARCGSPILALRDLYPVPYLHSHPKELEGFSRIQYLGHSLSEKTVTGLRQENEMKLEQGRVLGDCRLC